MARCEPTKRTGVMPNVAFVVALGASVGARPTAGGWPTGSDGETPNVADPAAGRSTDGGWPNGNDGRTPNVDEPPGPRTGRAPRSPHRVAPHRPHPPYG